MAVSNVTSTPVAPATSVPDPADPFLNTISNEAIAMQALALLTIFLDLPCFFWHALNRNFPAALLVGWVMVHNLISFVNALLWPIDNFSTFWRGLGYCDIMSRLDLAGTVSKVACALCIMHALARALNPNRVNSMYSGGALVRQRIFESGVCIGLPTIVVIGQFIVSDHRYDIEAITGCVADSGSTWLTIILVSIWPPLLCYVSCYFAVLIVIRLCRYKRDMALVLANSNTGLSKTRFIRLLGLSGIFILGYLPYTTMLLWYNNQYGMLDLDWSRVHNPDNWQTIEFIKSFGSPDPACWIKVSEGFIVFFAFGFGKDISTIYRRMIVTIGLSKMYGSMSKSFSSWKGSRGFREVSRSTVHHDTVSSCSKGCGLPKVRIASFRGSKYHREVASGGPSSPINTPIKPVHFHDVSTFEKCHPRSIIPSIPFSPPPVYNAPNRRYRPKDLTEKLLYDLDLEEEELAHDFLFSASTAINSPASTVPFSPASPTGTIIVPFNGKVVNTQDATEFDSSPSRPVLHSQTSDLALPPRSRFWTRMNNHVGARTMGVHEIRGLKGIMRGGRNEQDIPSELNYLSEEVHNNRVLGKMV